MDCSITITLFYDTTDFVYHIIQTEQISKTKFITTVNKLTKQIIFLHKLKIVYAHPHKHTGISTPLQ